MIPNSICVVDKVAERALELQQTFEKVAILSLLLLMLMNAELFREKTYFVADD